MDFNKVYEATHSLDAPLQSVEDGLPVRGSENTLYERIYREAEENQADDTAGQETTQPVAGQTTATPPATTQPTNTLAKDQTTSAAKIDTSKLPIIDIIVNDDETDYFAALENSKTKDEKDAALAAIKKYYNTVFTNNFINKSFTNNESKIKIQLVRRGINHCFQEGTNYNLWPAIRYLKTILENAYHDEPEESQHIDEPNTTRGDIAHIFYCKGKYITKIVNEEQKQEVKEKIHTLRIATVTFKQGNQINFNHLSKYKENNNVLCVELTAIDFA
jgi:hypothetical protein